MASPEYFRKQAEAFFELAKAFANEDLGLIYTMRALEFLSMAHAAEAGQRSDAIDARILHGQDGQA
jgi:hypothetical protein